MPHAVLGCWIFSLYSPYTPSGGRRRLREPYVISRALSTKLDRQIDSAAPGRSSRSRIIQAEEVVVDVPATRGGRVEQERLRTGRGAAEMRAARPARACACALSAAPCACVAGARTCENINGLVPPSTCAAQQAEAAERSRGAARVPGVWASCDATGTLGPAAAGRRRSSHR